MLRFAVGAIAITLCVCAAAAQQDIVSLRTAAMKQLDSDLGTLTAMVNGKVPFNVDVAVGKLALLNVDTIRARALFTNGVQETGARAVDPKIWQNMADFKAKFEKLLADGNFVTVKDFTSFKVAVSNISKDCSDCHDVYLVKSN